jgi:hypothetical protein
MAILDAVEPNHDAACLYRFRSGSSRVSSGCNEYVVGTVRPRGRRTRQGVDDPVRGLAVAPQAADFAGIADCGYVTTIRMDSAAVECLQECVVGGIGVSGTSTEHDRYCKRAC